MAPRRKQGEKGFDQLLMVNMHGVQKASRMHIAPPRPIWSKLASQDSRSPSVVTDRRRRWLRPSANRAGREWGAAYAGATAEVGRHSPHWRAPPGMVATIRVPALPLTRLRGCSEPPAWGIRVMFTIYFRCGVCLRWASGGTLVRSSQLSRSRWRWPPRISQVVDPQWPQSRTDIPAW